MARPVAEAFTRYALSEHSHDAPPGTSGTNSDGHGTSAGAPADPPSLDRHGFKCAFAALTGVKPSRAHWDALPKDSHGRLCQAAFADAASRVLSDRDAADATRQVFRAFDVRCAGFIARQDAHAVFSAAAPAVSARVVDEVFDELDLDRDGRVSFTDFATMMRVRV
ncbi:hypothetical protein FOA52_000961 [Chlamydomonas sp. UWO 241]|nr:hypothetical protein FOA52_000961 [Chlamydomonas sp. UWO 241]